MKHRMYNIRNNIRPPKIQDSQKESDTPLNQLVSLLKTLIQSKPEIKMEAKPYFANPKSHYQVEARDKQVYVDVPELIDNKISDKELKLWISDVFKRVCSSAFNYYSKNQMNFDQAKIYCSENIFKNIVLLSEKYLLGKKEMEMIDKHIKKGVLNYLLAKYPSTDSTQINKKLQAAVKQVDNIQSLQNNYFTNSKVVFEYRQSQNYDDLIMKMLNELMGSIDQLSNQQTSNYQQFEESMSELFQKVTDQQWMKNIGLKQSIKKVSEDKQKYKSKVKEYTRYTIGRKISQNTPLYTAREIQDGNISIKSPQVLRILTKWCEQLEQKYKNSYFSNRSQSVKLQRSEDISSLLSWMRQIIDANLELQRKNIDSSMNELFANNYQMQANLLESQLKKEGDEHVYFIQKVSGKFSYNIVKNLHTYIITYLNKLIHGLLSVSKFFVEEIIGPKFSFWSSPPNLLSFQIADLMRCKFTSKQKQVLKIYEQINRISRENPQKMKIVRIKNKLRMGTNDILMNVRFNNKVLCEIQLSITTKQSDFIKCSNSFNHYLYQLQRSLFGPLTELCSIWNSLDRRAKIYEELVEQEQNQQSKEHGCIKQNKIIKNQTYQKPFICSKCQHVYTHSQFIMPHTKCSLCHYILCAKCNINAEPQQALKKMFRKDSMINFSGKRVLEKGKIPRFGICSLIQCQNPTIELFNFIKYRSVDYLLGKKNGEIYQICKFKTQKDKKQFMKRYLVFQLNPNSGLASITEQDARNKYIIPLLTKINFSKQKESISLMDLALTTKQCRQIFSLGTHLQKQTVKNLFLTDNQIEQLPFESSEFSNLEWITLSRNKHLHILKGIQHSNNLKKIHIADCNLKQIPVSIYLCKSIQQINCSYNQIQQIDNRIANLQGLTIAQFATNRIKEICKGFYQCKKLKVIKIQNNFLTEVSAQIQNLQQLQILDLSCNKILSLPQEFGRLKRLKRILLRENFQLKMLPTAFTQLQLLQIFDISSTKICEIPINNDGWKNLRQFKISKTDVKGFPAAFQKNHSIQILNINNLKGISLQNLNFGKAKRINIQCNQLIIAPILKDCGYLKILNISSNQIQEIPSQNLQGLYQLEQLDCRKNLLTSLPSSISKMRKLKKLQLSQNRLKHIFSPDFESNLQFGKPIWPNIRALDLKSNLFQDIPLCLCYHSRIQKLQISMNLLKRLRPQIKQLKFLKHLLANNNSIEAIPYELIELKKLNNLQLKDNKIKHIPILLKTLPNLLRIQIDNCPIQTIEELDFWIFSYKSASLSKLAKKMKEQLL